MFILIFYVPPLNINEVGEVDLWHAKQLRVVSLV